MDRRRRDVLTRLSIVVVDLLLVGCLVVTASRLFSRSSDEPTPRVDPRELTSTRAPRDPGLARAGASLEHPARVPAPAPAVEPAKPRADLRLVLRWRDPERGAVSVIVEDADGQHAAALGDPSPERYALTAVTDRGATVRDTASRAETTLVFDDR